MYIHLVWIRSNAIWRTKNNLYDGPIIALTANALTGMREKYIEHGFTDYLSKPIEKTELNRILKTYLTK